MIKEKLKRYVEILNSIPDDTDKFSWLMKFGKESLDMQEQYKQKEFEIHGCQTRTWLVPHFIKNKYSFSADSDALISRGMVNLLADVFSGSTSKEILSFERRDLEDLRLDVLLTPGRRNGVHGMLQKIREYAQQPN
jgi:cysteine desulfuration protein SufE